MPPLNFQIFKFSNFQILTWGLFTLVLSLHFSSVHAQGPASVKESNKIFKTYPFSDPDPVPRMGNIYPYFRFDGYSDKGIDKSWKVVELQNDYISVMILPEIGGKIWTAKEKSTGRDFLYNNHVVKFRDIAMRGPWTSGGIEANYGIIGHTPNCATPVDYVARTDGQVIQDNVAASLRLPPVDVHLNVPHTVLLSLIDRVDEVQQARLFVKRRFGLDVCQDVAPTTILIAQHIQIALQQAEVVVVPFAQRELRNQIARGDAFRTH